MQIINMVIQNVQQERKRSTIYLKSMSRSPGFIYNEKRWPQELSSLSGPTPKNPTNCPSSKPRYMSFCESGKNAFFHNSVALSIFMASRTIWLKMSLYEMCQHLKNTETIAGISATSALTIFTDQRLPYAKITYE